MNAMTKRVIRWIVYNGLFFSALYLALIQNIHGAQNVVIFYTWLALIISALTLLPDVVKGMMKDPEVVPPKVWRAFDGIVDAFVVGAFIWFGWFWIGSAYLLHVIFLQQFWVRCDNYLITLLKGE